MNVFCGGAQSTEHVLREGQILSTCLNWAVFRWGLVWA